MYIIPSIFLPIFPSEVQQAKFNPSLTGQRAWRSPSNGLQFLIHLNWTRKCNTKKARDFFRQIAPDIIRVVSCYFVIFGAMRETQHKGKNGILYAAMALVPAWARIEQLQ